MRKSTKIVLIALIVTAVVAVVYFVVAKNLTTPSLNEREIRTEIEVINNLLSQAGIEELNDWYATAECGPTDAFLGYTVTHPDVINKRISHEQAANLKSVAAENGFTINNSSSKTFPMSERYTIVNSDNRWHIGVIHFDDGFARIHPTIPAKELYNFPHTVTFCG